MPVGQIVGRMNAVRSARDVIYDMVTEYVDTVSRLSEASRRRAAGLGRRPPDRRGAACRAHQALGAPPPSFSVGRYRQVPPPGAPARTITIPPLALTATGRRSQGPTAPRRTRKCDLAPATRVRPPVPQRVTFRACPELPEGCLQLGPRRTIRFPRPEEPGDEGTCGGGVLKGRPRGLT